jgi:hypothetical protein
VLASSYIHRVTVCTAEGSQPVLSFGSLQLRVRDFKFHLVRDRRLINFRFTGPHMHDMLVTIFRTYTCSFGPGVA